MRGSYKDRNYMPGNNWPASAKIAFLTTGLGFGGAEKQLYILAKYLYERGWDVEIFSMVKANGFGEELRRMGIPVKSLNMKRGFPDPRGLIILIQDLRKRKPTFLLCFMYHANFLGRIAGKIAGIPNIVTSIRTEYFSKTWILWVERLLSPFSQIVTTNSMVVANKLATKRVVPNERLRVIANAIDMNEFLDNEENYAVFRRDIGIKENEFLWLAIGRLEEPKDYYTMLRAFTIILKEERAYLKIAGQGPLFYSLNHFADSLGINEQVEFLGFVNNIPKLLNASDALVLSSAWEGLPNTVLEAHASARPVVATRVGGVEEIVEENVSGFVVPPRNPEALAAAMLRMMRLDKEEREAMGVCGREHIQKKFDINIIVKKWEHLLYNLSKKSE